MPRTNEAPDDSIASQDRWSRRSFMKSAVGHVGTLRLSSQFTEELAATQPAVFGEAQRDLRRSRSIRGRWGILDAPNSATQRS